MSRWLAPLGKALRLVKARTEKRLSKIGNREKLRRKRMQSSQARLLVCGVRRYSVVMVSGVVTTTGGRMNVTIRLTAKRVTAVSSISAEVGRTFHAQAA